MFTKVYLLDVPLENDYKHTLYFTSASTQNEYFSSRIKRTFTDFSYQRKDSVIRVPELYDNLLGCNYVMYQNSGKWFYAFITDMKYVNDERTDITIETDVIQTWFFDYNIKPSFVEREHVSNDNTGLHTVPEMLEHGEYTCNGSTTTGFTGHIVIATSYNFELDCAGASYINGIYHGVEYYLIGGSTYQAMYNTLVDFFGIYADKGKSDSIVAMFVAPDELTDYNSVTWKYLDDDNEHPYVNLGNIMSRHNATEMSGFVTAKPNNVDGYTPRNNKLLCYPYNYLMLSNNSGNSAIYRYEHFYSESCSFRVLGAITPGCSIRAFPTSYKNQLDHINEGLNLGKFPICSYANDVYTNWLTQNSVNIGTSIASSSLQIIGGGVMMASGAGAGAGILTMASGVVGITQTMGQVYQQSMIPPQTEGNLNCGDVMYSSGYCNFSYFQMCIKQEYAKMIDSYFDMFGYKVNRVKLPNKEHRSRWWYTKTIDINIDGAIPMNDLQKIKNCYNNGITFWRNSLEIQQYSNTNKIVLTAGAITDEQ